MAKLECKCGEQLWNGNTPNDIELVVYTDEEWSNIIEKDVLTLEKFQNLNMKFGDAPNVNDYMFSMEMNL